MSGWTWECPCGYSATYADLEQVQERQAEHRRTHARQMEAIHAAADRAAADAAHQASYRLCTLYGEHRYAPEPSGRGPGFDDECRCGAIRNARPII